MSATAHAKASLARAYSHGEEPTFVSVTPWGRDEIWKLGDVAFLVPVVPPGAPPELEYAIRLRRDAHLTGTCDECGATVDAADGANVDGVTLSTAIVSHRGNCPASDDLAGPMLNQFYDDLGAKDVETRVSTAVVSTREKIQREMQQVQPTLIQNPEFQSWAMALLEEKTGACKLCSHLASYMAQTWNMLLGDNEWRCDQCWAYLQAAMQRGTFRLDPLEDHTCDQCRRYVQDLTPLVIRIDHFILRGALCNKCNSARTKGDNSRDSHVEYA